MTVAGPKQYRLSDEARKTMDPVAEDTQLFQVLNIDPQRLRYEARTVTGRLYDAFELRRDARGQHGADRRPHYATRLPARTDGQGSYRPLLGMRRCR